LRINLSLLGMTKLFSAREVRPVLKVELNKAIAMREKLKRRTVVELTDMRSCRRVRVIILAMLLACSAGCTLKPKCLNGPGDVPNNCLPLPPSGPRVNYHSIGP
jgi:hypothetical protein